MATFEWQGLCIYVGEMSRAAALECARDFQAFLQSAPSDELLINAEIDYLYCHYSPCQIKQGGVVVESFTVVNTPDASRIITLPLTRDTLNGLPISLAASWAKAAGEANSWLTDFFTTALTKIVQAASATSPASASS